MNAPHWHEEKWWEEVSEEEQDSLLRTLMIQKSMASAKRSLWPWFPILLLIFLVIGLVLFILLFVTVSGTKEEQGGSLGWKQGAISELGANEIPAPFLPIYRAAAEKYQVPWNVLAAIHKVETSFSTDVSVSSTGAVGHSQFMKKTWLGWGWEGGTRLGDAAIPEEVLTSPAMIKRYGGYGVDGDGDGKADPMNVKDAIFSTAHYLAENGAVEGKLSEAVYQYNHSQAYVQRVLSLAELYVKDGVVVQVGEGENGMALGKQGSRIHWPSPVSRVTSAFGYRIHPTLHTRKLHAGIDIGAPQGTPVLAAASGVVLRSGFQGGYGNMVEIDHGNGVVTRYGHMETKGVPVGTRIRAGEQVGRTGSTGRSTGPHLHFEVRVHGTPVDPQKVVRK